MNWSSFLAELKRRNVYKVAVTYAAIAWLLMQMATVILPWFEMPGWVIRLIILLLLGGFPVAVVLAWAVELTPEGRIELTKDATPGEVVEGPARRRFPRWALVSLVLLVVGLCVPVLLRRSAPQAVQKTVEPVVVAAAQFDAKSIAVLPFENLSEEKANAYFASGMQDEILTTLSRISGLRVISRTSTQRFAGSRTDLREIARELRVANILEGSVQKVGDRVHINVQLIRAESDTHLWAESYDRTLSDIFGVQGEVAKNIAESLSAAISQDEMRMVEKMSTENAEAWMLYLRAREHETQVSVLLKDYQTAMTLYEQAIAADPTFALAHARLSTTLGRIYHSFEPTEALKQKARAEAEEALRLLPGLGEGHLALGLSYYWGDRDYARGLQEFDEAARLLPNDGEARLYAAAIHRRQGHWKLALAGFQQAQALDPGNQVIAQQLAVLYNGLRDWPAAATAWDRVVKLAPDELNPKIFRGYVDFWAKGDTAPLRKFLDGLPPGFDPEGQVTQARCDISLVARDFAAAEKALAECKLESLNGGAQLPRAYLQGCIALAQGKTEQSQGFFEQARGSMEEDARSNPENAFRQAYLGLIYAHLGRREDALREGRRAVELSPESADRLNYARISAYLALIYARTGENDAALELIGKLLVTPGASDSDEESITLQDLRARWGWDPLRNDPRFQKILAGPEPVTLAE